MSDKKLSCRREAARCFVFVCSQLQHTYSAVFTRYSLVRAKGEVFVLLYVYLFVFLFGQRFLDNPRAFTPKFACGPTLVPDVFSPLLGVSGPRRTEKGEMKFSLLWESMGNFCILAVFERYISNAWTDPHQIKFLFI